MRTTKERTSGPEEPEFPSDYFIVGSIEHGEWYVSCEMARHVEACLERQEPGAWVTFVDLTGARVRVRARLIAHVIQRTAEQRALERTFHRRNRREAKADRDWEDEDW